MRTVTLSVLNENGVDIVCAKEFILAQIVPDTIAAVGGGPFWSKTTFKYITSSSSSTPIRFIVNESVDYLLAKMAGTLDWGYAAGVSGTVTLSGGKRVSQITAIGQEAPASFTINGGDAIQLPYASTDRISSSIVLTPASLFDPTIVFTGTKSYIVEYTQE